MQKRVFLSNKGNVDRLQNGNMPINQTVDIDVVAYNHERKLEKSKVRLETLFETHKDFTLEKVSVNKCYRILDELSTRELILFIENYNHFLASSKDLNNFFIQYLSLLE